ncbi:VOC family protein [Micromonospora sp. DT47]|uniref:VOC family protein n=1 Tax=Micromonospora sp. DT47 TaxID=3393431 RepID=UPI003CEC2BDF
MANTSPGMLVWVDLSTSDLAGATDFYTQLFGWTAHVAPEPEAMGYTIFNKDGKPAAGAGPLMAEGNPVAWLTHLNVTDADEAAEKITKAGGQVIVPPMDVMTQGRFAVVVDQGGAPFGLWQPRDMTGAEIFNQPGSYTWSELTTRDPKGSKEFYNAVFGWVPDDRASEQFTYTTFKLGGDPAAGLMPMEGDLWPPDLPNHWMVYFAVADTDETAAKAVELGGAAPVPPQEIPPGRFAVLTDPQGGHFSIIKMNPDFQA